MTKHKIGMKLWRTEDLKQYECIGKQVVTPPWMKEGFEDVSYVYQKMLGTERVLINEKTPMNTTRDWANTREMAISDKIKLLENQILSLKLLGKSA